MTDIVDTATRSWMMSGIRGKNTRPELIVRQALHKAGFRFRLHRKNLPGKPDLILPKYHTVIFVHGCFWHGHDCHLFKWPASREDFWREKINSNINRDKRVTDALVADGWRVLRIWECSLKGKNRHTPEQVAQEFKEWLNTQNTTGDIVGGEAIG